MKTGDENRLPRLQTCGSDRTLSALQDREVEQQRGLGEERVESVRSQGYLDSVGDVLEPLVRDLQEREGQGVHGGRRVVGGNHAPGEVTGGVRTRSLFRQGENQEK